ncbi:MAG: HNH endonuclease [Cellulomonadaceae bacterium]|nr:HNH endonuclease [Cellulomonadaceae bacterium]
MATAPGPKESNRVKAPVKQTRKARDARRRKRRVAAANNDLTLVQWSALKLAWKGCAYCGCDTDALQKDCVQPIARGGRYTVSNVVPACRSCNTSKCDQEVTTWLRRKRLDEKQFLTRLIQISSSLDVGVPPD